MNLILTLVAAFVAGLVSVIVGIISYFSNRTAVRHQVQQTQFKEVLAKRIELYPKLWQIHIFYETHWVNERKPKTREWAEQYVVALNDFNLEGGVFFSEDLYRKFRELRDALYAAVDGTEPGSVVDEELDLGVIEALRKKDLDHLARLDPKRLQAGSSEIRSWIVTAATAAAAELDLDWVEYIPAYRTPALTGTGLGFARWS